MIAKSPGTGARPISGGGVQRAKTFGADAPGAANVSARASYTIPTTHRVVWSPRHESRPYRQHPSRREHIHGPVQPMDAEPLPSWAVWLVLLVVAAFGLPVIMGGQ